MAEGDSHTYPQRTRISAIQLLTHISWGNSRRITSAAFFRRARKREVFLHHRDPSVSTRSLNAVFSAPFQYYPSCEIISAYCNDSLVMETAECCVSGSRKNIAIFLLKALVTAACLWWLARYFDFKQIRTALAGIDPLLLSVAIALHFLSYVAGGVRWWLLFRHLNGPIAFRQIWPSYYLGVFFNNMLPTAFGGDLARTARLYAAGLSGSALVGSAFIDRVLGLFAVVGMGGLALLFAPSEYENQLALSVFGLSMLVLLPIAVVAVLPQWAKLFAAGYSSRWPRVHAVLACFPRFRTAPGLLLKAFGLSVLNQLMVVLVLLMLAPGLGVHLPMFQFMVVLMLVFLVSSLPISLGGLGAREGAMMSLLLPLGADAASILALSVAYLLVLWCTTLPGAFMLLLREPNAPDATAP